MFPNPQIGDFVIPWFTLIICIDAVICTLFFYKQYLRVFRETAFVFKRWKVFFLVVLSSSVFLFFGFLGAKLLSKIEIFFTVCNAHTLQDFTNILMNHISGYSWYGGFLFDMSILPLLLIFFSKKKFLALLDITALTACLAYGIGRFACLLTGDRCYGTWTNLPWGMYFPYGNFPNLLPVHPTPLYESLIHFILFILVFRIDKRKIFLGQPACVFFFFTALSRFFIEFIRLNNKIAFDLTMAQLISIFLILFSLFLYYYLSTHKTLITKNLPT